MLFTKPSFSNVLSVSYSEYAEKLQHVVFRNDSMNLQKNSDQGYYSIEWGKPLPPAMIDYRRRLHDIMLCMFHSTQTSVRDLHPTVVELRSALQCQCRGEKHTLLQSLLVFDNARGLSFVAAICLAA